MKAEAVVVPLMLLLFQLLGTSSFTRKLLLLRRNANAPYCRFRSSSNKNSNNEDTTAAGFEASLEHVESEALYGLGSKQSELSNFARQLEEGRLNLFPTYQRSYVWQPDKASRLIVTALCNRFIPPLVLHETSKGVFDVVDGKQRLTSLLGFYLNRSDAKLPPDPTKTKMLQILPKLATLSKLEESYESLNGLSFDDLTLDRRRAFESYTISYIVIPRNTPKPDVFEVYEDINSGGEDLTPQQVRRAVYHGPYMSMIDTLKELCSDFHAVRSPKTFHANAYEPCKRDSDGELILRAFAFRQNGERFRTPIKTFLNRELDGTADFDPLKDNEQRHVKERRIKEMVQAKREEFESVMRIARLVFGDNAFRKKKKNTISPTMFDSKYCAIAELLVNFKEIDFVKAKDRIAFAVEESLENGFFSTDDERTSAKKFEERKYQLKTMIRDAIEGRATAKDAGRQFPTDWRMKLYADQNGICPLCDQTIADSLADDGSHVHIDHIIPHSKGGRTEYDNAQLVHRACNLNKGAKMAIQSANDCI